MSYNRSSSASGGGAGFDADGFLIPDPAPRGSGSPVGADGAANTRSDGWRNPTGFGWLEGQLPPAGFRGASEYTKIGPGSAAFANNPAKFTTGMQRSRKPRK
jgi:hypothetical protein